jgi:putative oxidoreductase
VISRSGQEGVLETAVVVLRIVMGVYLLANGLNFYFNFFTLKPPKNEIANVLMDGFIRSGMFNVVKVAEVLGGVALILDLFVPLSLIALFPIVIIIAWIDIFILKWELGGIWNGGIFFILFVFLLFLYLPYYEDIFTLRASPDVTFSVVKNIGYR